MAALRNISRKPDADLPFKISGVAGTSAGLRRDRFPSTVDRRLSKHGVVVRRNLLDAAGVCAPGLGACRRIAGRVSHRSLQLLDELLLGGLHGGAWRCACSGCGRAGIRAWADGTRPVLAGVAVCGFFADPCYVATL